jgi:hypothetical protein
VLRTLDDGVESDLGLPAMPTTVTVGGRHYGSNDEVACADAGRKPDGTRLVTCLDPRGKVAANDPFDSALVCRIGPHVLPLAACETLLAAR